MYNLRKHPQEKKISNPFSLKYRTLSNISSLEDKSAMTLVGCAYVTRPWLQVCALDMTLVGPNPTSTIAGHTLMFLEKG